MQIDTTNKSTLSFLQAGCPSCHPTNNVKALKENDTKSTLLQNLLHSYMAFYHRQSDT